MHFGQKIISLAHEWHITIINSIIINVSWGINNFRNTSQLKTVRLLFFVTQITVPRKFQINLSYSLKFSQVFLFSISDHMRSPIQNCTDVFSTDIDWSDKVWTYELFHDLLWSRKYKYCRINRKQRHVTWEMFFSYIITT